MMQRAGFNVVRMAEFAWSKMEPSEGDYDFEWLDSAVSILGKRGIAVILGTPTGSMPPWVALKSLSPLQSMRTATRCPMGVGRPTALPAFHIGCSDCGSRGLWLNISATIRT